jgi:hypothetical protein
VFVLRSWLLIAALPEVAKAVSATRRAALRRKAIPVVLVMGLSILVLALACYSCLEATKNQHKYQITTHMTYNRSEINKLSCTRGSIYRFYMEYNRLRLI